MSPPPALHRLLPSNTCAASSTCAQHGRNEPARRRAIGCGTSTDEYFSVLLSARALLREVLRKSGPHASGRGFRSVPLARRDAASRGPHRRRAGLGGGDPSSSALASRSS